MKRHVIFYIIIFLFFISSSCRRAKSDINCDVNYKVENITLYQNITDSINTINYDSIQFGIERGHVYAAEEFWCNPNFVLIDYYKSISIISLNKYNSVFNSADTINEIINEVEFFPENRQGMVTAPIYFNSIQEFFQYNNGKSLVCKLLFKLATPPDSVRLLQLKIIVKLWDNREFILYSKPVNIK